ncbi:hypothetical protein MRB53_030186 [Persea americana]|uniref:Uncharacterized protein n=1 Tax=Persea americana TaxID=3435 RepID=A0ACC2KKQ1_PERAE|nr:hypothetical protein MRB53_030186 [Persea americana]|eukprot:TRINITY_DN39579_c2_g1_i1.p1 TRINITY_DN39579_c2_g1~~TRINITY_DN39579_c2_g1_i1.p1  ORF type:complete len:174 (+),score=24.61 TRINITY_DN39579_c2_g1_i1:80-601(+)
MPLSICAPKTLTPCLSFPPLPFRKLHLCPQSLPTYHHHSPLPPLSTTTSCISRRRGETLKTLVYHREEFHPEFSAEDEVWLERLPDMKEALNSHTLQSVRAWLKKLGFRQDREDRARFSIERPDWHAMIALDVTELHIRYLKSGPGNLKKDVDRKLSYKLSREEIENAILKGP